MANRNSSGAERASNEKGQRLVGGETPAQKRKRLAKEEAEWASKSGPVTIIRREDK